MTHWFGALGTSRLAFEAHFRFCRKTQISPSLKKNMAATATDAARSMTALALETFPGEFFGIRWKQHQRPPFKGFFTDVLLHQCRADVSIQPQPQRMFNCLQRGR